MNTFFDALLSSMFVCSSYTVMKYSYYNIAQRNVTLLIKEFNFTAHE